MSLYIQRYSHEGKGIAQKNNKVFFVENALIGEQVFSFETVQAHQKWNIVRPRFIVDPAPSGRQLPPCQFFTQCGGCQLQHMTVQMQRHLKEELLHSRLEHAHILPESWAPSLSETAWLYRRRARLHLHWSTQSFWWGFKGAYSNTIVEIDSCAVLTAGINLRMPSFHRQFSQLNRRGATAELEITQGQDNQYMLILKPDWDLSNAERSQLANFADEQNIHLYCERFQRFERLGTAVLSPLSYPLAPLDLSLEFGPGHFIQPHQVLNEKMVMQALDWLKPNAADQAVDFFCGIGNFTLPLAQRVRSVEGFELNQSALRQGAHNARKNGLQEKCQFKQYNLLRTAKPFNQRWTLALLDPPRDGAWQLVQQWPSSIQKLIYLSCNPASFVRDAQCLIQAKGYRLKRMGLIDQFPQTEHVELMALFEK